MKDVNPYSRYTDEAFWKPSVAALHIADWRGLWEGFGLTRSDKVATAGSCFAQHIGEELKKRGANFMDLEPDPGLFSSEAEARRWGFGVFSARYGNIYTSRQLLQLFDESFGDRSPREIVWQRGNRYYDALRPGVDPVGHASANLVTQLREKHLAHVRRMFLDVDVFVFTLGLTEGWELRADNTMYPVAPGTLAGSYSSTKYRFKNLRYPDIYADLRNFWDRLRTVNPQARMLLTVSPVPLTATASGEHVLVATTYSKSVLRAVAGDLARDVDDIYYFPSYELIATHPSRGMFFNPDLRTVNAAGVKYVMTHFFSGYTGKAFADSPIQEDEEELDLICDEETLDRAREQR